MLLQFIRLNQLKVVFLVCLPQITLISFVLLRPPERTEISSKPDSESSTPTFNISESKLWTVDNPGSRFPEPPFADDIGFPNVCEAPLENHVMLVVPSKSVHYEIRLAIRSTWFNLSSYDNLKFNYTLLFVIGRPVLNYKLANLVAEKQLFEDVLVTNIDEDYRDLTVHLLLAYEWIKNVCPSVKYIYKIDDDTYVHLKYTEKYVKRLEFLRITSNETTSAIYGGTCFQTQRVIRNASKISVESKWIVPKEVYSGGSYPPYCNGPIYFFSASLLENITKECPSHCVKDPEENSTIKTSQKPGDQDACFWQFEDVFFGSCFYSMKPRPFIMVQRPRMFLMQSFRAVRFLKNTVWAALHPVKRVQGITQIYCRYFDCSEERKSRIHHLISIQSELLALKSIEIPEIGFQWP